MNWRSSGCPGDPEEEAERQLTRWRVEAAIRRQEWCPCRVEVMIRF